MKPRVCLVTFGSAGDVVPLIVLGRHLRAAGYPVSFLTNPVDASRVQDAGLDFEPIGDCAQYRDTMAHPKLWHPVDGLGVLWRYLLRPALEPVVRCLERVASHQRCVVVASPLAMGARIAQERFGLPLVSAYTSATLLRSIEHPMTLAQWTVPRWWPAPWRRALWSAIDRAKLEPLVRPALDGLRAKLGLEPVAGPVFGRWMHSPQAGVALFPCWFAPARGDWPAQVVQAGFPIETDRAAGRLPDRVGAFLGAGSPPVVFMPGTGRHDDAAFFDAARHACEALGVRGLFLSRNPDALGPLPAGVHADSHLPFEDLLPRCRAIVHHGGIGTCAQALHAGLVQLVLPQGYDQFDNARELVRLGAGSMLPATRVRPATLAQHLGRVLGEAGSSRRSTWSARTTGCEARVAVLRVVESLS